MERPTVRPLILALAVAMAPLLLQLPGWAVVWCAGWWAFRFVGAARGWPEPSHGMRRLAFFAGMVAIVGLSGLRFDGVDFITLLAVMAGIKPLEVRGRRDQMVAVFLAYFLVITSLFVFENLSMTLYLFLAVWIVTGVLIHVTHPRRSIGGQMRLAGRLVATAVPLTVLLFLLFPRLSGGFWGSPWSRQGRSGFSSVMRINDVSRLALVDAPAFTAAFENGRPAADQCYWRGIVFTRFDGQAWQPAGWEGPRRDRVSGTERSRYQVILEPHGQRYLFALDLPVEAVPLATLRNDNTMVVRRPLHQRFHYLAASYLDYRQAVSGPPGERYLQLPPSRNPRTTALARTWVETVPTTEGLVQAAMTLFRETGFVYTLRPDRLGRDAVDDFLFNSRKGFCEHYATAFAVLMRAAGIPTRLVGGYQGGRWNPIGGFLTVRQSDAHVWCEVWFADKGWVRVDPTYAVAPDRIDLGIESAVAAEGLPGFLAAGKGHVLAWLRQTLEVLNVRWDMWFMGFSAEAQLALLKRLGLSIGYRWRWLPVTALPPVLIVAVILLWKVRKRLGISLRGDATLSTYHRFLEKMRRAGLPKQPYQGPRDYARQVIERCPGLGAAVESITDSYVALRYGPAAPTTSLKAFRRQVRQFRPRRLLSNEKGGDSGGTVLRSRIRRF